MGLDVVYDVWARECFRVLKHGGHIVAFGATRTIHRMVVALEDEGFEIRDMINWLYFSGFPKSMDISKQIDKMKGVEREVVGESNAQVGVGWAESGNAGYKPFDITKPTYRRSTILGRLGYCLKTCSRACYPLQKADREGFECIRECFEVGEQERLI